jgi:hypothetical protein
MSRNLVRPFFPDPPREYSHRYLAEVVRSFATYLVNMQNPGEGRNTFTVFTNLQTDDVDLEIGTIFQQDGFVKITQAHSPHPRGSSATGLVGSVTVTTT